MDTHHRPRPEAGAAGRPARCRRHDGRTGGTTPGCIGEAPMRTTLDAAAASYLKAKTLSRGTRNEYRSTLRKWGQWGQGVPIAELQRKHVRAFLDWVYERAVAD